MKKVLIISFFKSSNIGDIAITEMLCSELDGYTAYKMDISGQAAGGKEVKTNTAKSPAHVRVRLRCLKSIISLLRKKRVAYLKSVIDDCDFILFAGGNMIMDTEPYPASSLLCYRYLKIAKRKKVKYGFAFTGAGPVRNGLQKLLWKKVLKNSEFIAVRDSYSRDYLLNDIKLKKKCEIWQDPVLGLPERGREDHRNCLAVNIFANCIKDNKKLIDFYCELVNNYSKKTKVILFTTESRDEEGMKLVYEKLKDKDNVSVRTVSSCGELAKMYEECGMAVCTRMHSFIIALSQGLPAIALAWQGKIKGLAADLDLTDYLFDVNNIDGEFASVINKIDGLTENMDKTIACFKELQTQLKNKHNENFNEVRQRLDRILKR